MSDYRAISCEQHSEYELLIMRRQRLQISGRSERGEERELAVLPLDLISRAGEEFLLVETEAGERLEFRLDRIIEARPLGS
jgi:transcriptional antiterminator Rof (Rho-off)